MNNLQLLEESGVDVSKFLLAPYPTFEWNITKQCFQRDYELSDSEDITKVYILQNQKVNQNLINKLKTHNGTICWMPTDDENILRFALVKALDEPISYYVITGLKDVDLKNIVKFNVFDTQEEVLKYYKECREDKIFTIEFFKIIKGVEKRLKPVEIVTEYEIE